MAAFHLFQMIRVKISAIRQRRINYSNYVARHRGAN